METNNGLKIQISDKVLRFTIDRPEVLNAMTAEMLDEFTETLQQHADDPAVRAAVITGSARAFCSGADLTPANRSAAPTAHRIDAANQVVAAIQAFPHPVIGAVNGPAVGAGVCLALACDLTIAAESAYFMLAFTRIGLMPDAGATALIAASIGRARAMRLALLAERLTAADALQAGLIAAVHPDHEFASQVESIVRRIADGPAAALGATKAAINAATLTALPSAFSREREGQLSLLTSADHAEGVAAFRQKRTAVFGAAPS